MPRVRRVPPGFLLILLALLAWASPARGQGSPTPSPSPSAAPTIPLAAIAESTAEVNGRLRALDEALREEASVQQVRAGLPPLAEQLERHLQQDERLLLEQPGPDALRAREVALVELGSTLQGWKAVLLARAAVLEEQVQGLDGMRQRWAATAVAARDEGAPEVIQAGIDEVLASLDSARQRVQARQGELFTLQQELSERQSRLAEGRAALARARQPRMDQALAQDSPPLWRIAPDLSMEGLGERLLSSLGVQQVDLEEYARHRAPRLAAWVVVFGLLLLALRWARRHAAPWVASDPDLRQVTRILEAPVATALLLTLALGRAGDPGAPRLFLGLLGVATLVPAVLTLRRLLDPYLLPVLHLLLVFFLVDQGRLVSAGVPTLGRLLLLAETLAGMLFLAWYLHPSRFASVSEADRPVLQARTLLVGRVALGFLAASTLANVFGFVALAALLGGATLRGAYTAMVLVALLRILQALAVFAFHVPPLVLSRAVRQHQALLADRTSRVLQVLAGASWLFMTLESLSLREPVVAAVGAVLGADLSVGNVSLSLGGVLTFLVAVWGATLLSRFLRFVLDEDVLPRLDLDRGTSHALSLTLHYAVLLLGLLIAMAAVGLDLTRFTVLAGALGVGIGFGLQNIVNNFVSGMILLFDRSLSIGDPIQFGAHQGELVRIGLRASTVRLVDGRNLIVPNSDLIEQQVINGTALTLQPRRIELTFALAEPVEGQAVLELLAGLAGSHEAVARTPEPQALFLGYQDGAPTFQLLAWTLDAARAHLVRSELAVALGEALRAAGHRVAGPRREVRLVTPQD